METLHRGTRKSNGTSQSQSGAGWRLPAHSSRQPRAALGMSIPRLVHTDIAALCPSPPELGEFGPNRWSPPPFAVVPATPAASPGQEMPECLGGLERKETEGEGKLWRFGLSSPQHPLQTVPRSRQS